MGDIWVRLTGSAQAAAEALRDPVQWWQFGVLALAVAFAWAGARAFGRLTAPAAANRETAYAQAARVGSRIAFPAVLGTLTLVVSAVMARLGLPHAVASVVAILALTLAGVRLAIDILKRVLRPGPLLIASEHLIAWTAWALVAMYLLGWLAPVAAALEGIRIPVGQEGYSLLDALRALVTMLLFLAAGAWLGSLATRGIMASQQISIGLRVGISKFVRLFLLLIAGLLGLNAVGIDLAALAVFGGALGIGLGFGLQRIAANFVSGFILVGDRSIRQGDVITIGDRFGVVQELRARYIVVRDRDGVDTLIPNENVISSEVVNWSYGDRAIRLKLPVQISYRDDPRKALRLLEEAAANHARVLHDPAPASRVIKFGDNGIELELRFWIRDPESGVNNVRSDLHLEIWDRFQQAGITIPFPQRDLHLPDGWTPKPDSEPDQALPRNRVTPL